MSLITVLGVILTVSLVVNIIFAFYGSILLKDMLFVSDELAELQERTEEYRDHLDIVYELETFYGDETLNNLLRHTKDFSEYLTKFDDAANFSFLELLEEEENLELNEYEEENDARQEKTTQTGKVVFYGGP